MLSTATATNQWLSLGFSFPVHRQAALHIMKRFIFELLFELERGKGALKQRMNHKG
jgi:hypothetical protein